MNLKVGDIWFECDVKITKIEFTHFCNSNTVYMLFYKRSTWWKHLRSIGLVPMDAYNLLSELRRSVETPYSTGSSWRPPSMHCLLSFIFVTFLVLWPLSPAASSVSWYWSYLVYSELAYEIYSGGGPSAYVYCLVCYRVIVAPNVWSVGHVFTYLYTLDDNLESHSLWTMRLFLLPKVFPLVVIFHDQHINCHQWCITWFYI